MPKYLLGCGNYTMGDDAIGLKIVEIIAERHLDSDFTAIDIGHDSLRLCDYFREDTTAILLVDCVKMGLAPGSHQFFTLQQVVSEKSLLHLTTHESDILRVIELAQTLGYPIPPIIILGIEPARIEFNLALSPTLQEKLEEYIGVAVAKISTQDLSLMGGMA